MLTAPIPRTSVVDSAQPSGLLMLCDWLVIGSMIVDVAFYGRLVVFAGPILMPLHQWDYIFAFGTIFAALDAYNTGANDVANSFATSVASRSLTLKQACLAASICEFLGAVLVGARVTGTIKNGIIPLSTFQENAGVQLLGFTCALVASSTWLMLATRNSWPVSTTYSIVSALIGVGVATGGSGAVSWGWNNGQGAATIFAGFFIAPAIAAVFASIVFMATKWFVLLRKDSVRAGLIASPVYFFGVASILTMSIIYKGAPTLNIEEYSSGKTAAIIIGTASVVALLSMLFWLPFVYCKVIKHDYALKWYHILMGPLLWMRSPPEDAGLSGRQAVPDYAIGHNVTVDQEGSREKDEDRALGGEVATAPGAPGSVLPTMSTHSEPVEEFSLGRLKNLWVLLRYKSIPFLKKVVTHGTTVDVHALQSKPGTKTAERLKDMHARASQYPNSTEHLFSFLQVLTACTASFAHGSNDVANAIGPYSAIYEIWHTGRPAGSASETPVWMLVFGASCLVVGLGTYGYNIMRVLGNRLTMHSPSRGFSMELGSSITVVLASQYGIPVSTTMCITGATMGVAMCNGDVRAFKTNWRGFGWIFLGWILTVPVAAVSAGCLMGIILNAPHF